MYICDHCPVKPVAFLSPYCSKARKNTLSHNTLVWQGTIAALTLNRRSTAEDLPFWRPAHASAQALLKQIPWESPVLQWETTVPEFQFSIGREALGSSLWNLVLGENAQLLRVCQMRTAKSKQQQTHQTAERMIHASPEDVWVGLILLAQQHKVITSPRS